MAVRLLGYKKYRNVKTIVDDIKFDSKAEARRYQDLSLLRDSGVIEDLELQKRYDLIVNGLKICKYYADFVYKVKSTGEVIVEDVKGGPTKTAVFSLKKKLMKACFNIDVRIYE